MPYVIRATRRGKYRTITGKRGAIRAFGTKRDAIIARKAVRKFYDELPKKKRKKRIRFVIVKV
jgi:hypothetical protein